MPAHLRLGRRKPGGFSRLAFVPIWYTIRRRKHFCIAKQTRTTIAIGLGKMNDLSSSCFRHADSAARRRRLLPQAFFIVLTCSALLAVPATAQVEDRASPPGAIVQLILGEANVCELVKNGIPHNSAIVFSVSSGRIYCFTDFSVVGAKTVIYHNWYHRDQKRTSVKLALRPPRWATFSSMALRNADKGPWQVEVTDEKGEVLKILRFSVID